MPFKVFVKLGAGYEDGTYCFDKSSKDNEQREFSDEDVRKAEALKIHMNQLYPEVVYEVHDVSFDGTVLAILH